MVLHLFGQALPLRKWNAVRLRTVLKMCAFLNCSETVGETKLDMVLKCIFNRSLSNEGVLAI